MVYPEYQKRFIDFKEVENPGSLIGKGVIITGGEFCSFVLPSQPKIYILIRHGQVQKVWDKKEFGLSLLQGNIVGMFQSNTGLISFH